MPRVLIIGAGGIAKRHVENLLGIDHLQIAGVCDIDAARACALAQKAGAPAYTDASTALDSTNPDYAVILTPRHVREPLIDLCLEHKVPFLVEKPPCHRLSVGQRIRHKLEKSGLLHSVGFMHRWHEALNAALAELKEERITIITIRFVAPFATAPVLETYPDPYSVERSGGLVGDQGIHYVDIARYITGSEAEAIEAVGTNQLLETSDKVTTCDAACWTMKMRDGVLVSHAHTWCGNGWDCRIELVTDRSRIAVDMFGNSARGMRRGHEYRFDGKTNEFELEHRGFLRALESRDMKLVRSTFADALESFRLAAEINRAVYGRSLELDVACNE